MVVKPALGTFVTVHDYLETLHPWLVGLREDIRCLTDVWQCGVRYMMVECGVLNDLVVEEEEEWIRWAAVLHPNVRPSSPWFKVEMHYGPDLLSDG